MKYKLAVLIILMIISLSGCATDKTAYEDYEIRINVEQSEHASEKNLDNSLEDLITHGHELKTELPQYKELDVDSNEQEISLEKAFEETEQLIKEEKTKSVKVDADSKSDSPVILVFDEPVEVSEAKRKINPLYFSSSSKIEDHMAIILEDSYFNANNSNELNQP